ncbi:MAG TPA: hypothetical protein QGF51_01600 [Candidatus Marinimicrobia bacterium]|jgi:hypothetical protein|nr:hypothetical protein [Candidatus Neomarinimicrobiota bacterium]HJN97647.1 hypothetical protein [Candidatus Neomarinimicrobiota bacterium]
MNNQYKLKNTQIANETFALGIDINLVQINNLLIDLFILVIIGLAVQIA